MNNIDKTFHFTWSKVDTREVKHIIREPCSLNPEEDDCIWQPTFEETDFEDHKSGDLLLFKKRGDGFIKRLFLILKNKY